ncbi:MAG: branched-chain amino acid ABC transporter permease [Planctomycetes bacterium]|nr:branched-chain amino acid ABC transporter permease [Planctomycetota bacterium]
MRDRIVRLLVATLAAFLLALPVASLRGNSSTGFTIVWTPAFVTAAMVLVGGAILFAAVEAQRRGTAFWDARAATDSAVGRRRPCAAQAWTLGVLVATVAALPLLGLPGAWTKLLLETMVFATIAVGLQITIGMAGLLVLGHAAFWAVGAYTFGLLTVHQGWNFWIAFPAAGVAAALTGLVIGLPALRLRGDYLAVVTLGFGEAVRWVIKNEQDVTGGDANLPGNIVPGSFRKPMGALGEWLWQPAAVDGRTFEPGTVQALIDRECYWFALVLLVVCVACVHLLAKSRVGRALFALREDETAAKCMGIDTTRVKLVAFMASALWAGLAGVVPAVHRGSINPEMFDFNTSVLFVAMVVLGGLGSITGSIVGAALLWMLPALLANWFPEVQEYRYLFFGALMAAMMVVRPEGLFGGARRKGAA